MPSLSWSCPSMVSSLETVCFRHHRPSPQSGWSRSATRRSAMANLHAHGRYRTRAFRTRAPVQSRYSGRHSPALLRRQRRNGTNTCDQAHGQRSRSTTVDQGHAKEGVQRAVPPVPSLSGDHPTGYPVMGGSATTPYQRAKREPGSAARVPQDLRGFFGRRRIEVEPGRPLEPGHLRQLRNDLDVPVVEVRRGLADRRAVDQQVVRRRAAAPGSCAAGCRRAAARATRTSWRGASSKCAWCRRGRIHVSNGNRGAYGATATMSAFSAIRRRPSARLLAQDVAEDAALLRLRSAPSRRPLRRAPRAARSAARSAASANDRATSPPPRRDS